MWQNHICLQDGELGLRVILCILVITNEDAAYPSTSDGFYRHRTTIDPLLKILGAKTTNHKAGSFSHLTLLVFLLSSGLHRLHAHITPAGWFWKYLIVVSALLAIPGFLMLRWSH